MQPHDDKLTAVSDWFSREAPTYQHSRVFRECGSRLSEFAAIEAGERVLDVGTGSGAVLFPAAAAAGETGAVVGIDLAEPMLATARAEARRREILNVELHQMNAEQLSFPDQTFDVVVSGFVLSFIPDLTLALAEVRRVLRDGGRLGVSVWAAPSDVAGRIRALRDELIELPPIPSSQTFRSEEALTARLEEAGFRVVRASTERVTTEFADENDWWTMERAFWGSDGLPAELTARFKQGVFEIMRSGRNEGEPLQDPRVAIFVTAEKS